MVAASLTAATVGMSAPSAAEPQPHGSAAIDPTELHPAEAGPLLGSGRAGTDVSDLGTGTDPASYFVVLDEPAVPGYVGGTPELSATQPAPGEQLDPAAPPVQAYEAHLEDEQAQAIASIEEALGREIEVPFTYQFAANGFAAVLTPHEARIVAAQPSIASITKDEQAEAQNFGGPETIGADDVWNGVATLGLPFDARGEGVVIGIVDSGISPLHPSFADVGSDGHDHTNPRGRYYGACDPANEQYDPSFPCNDKLIGAYTFVAPTPLDWDGHGTVVASAAAGNVLHDVSIPTWTGATGPIDLSGVAPHANIIAYQGFLDLGGSYATFAAAIEQAIRDEVDVLNLSIRSSPAAMHWDDPTPRALLNARAAGIFVASIMGNEGLRPRGPGAPGSSPWSTVVGASSHRLRVMNALTQLSRDDGTTLADVPGAALTGPLPGPAPIVDAAALGDPDCEDGEVLGGAVTGAIVVCRERGDAYGQSLLLDQQGAAGIVVILEDATPPPWWASWVHLPGLEISSAASDELLAWLAVGTGHVASISATSFVEDTDAEDILAPGSSRGPNLGVDVIAPTVTAPGVAVAAAQSWNDGDPSDDFTVTGGQSLAAPHVAGAGALLTQVRPGWTPAQMQSALMTTAFPGVVDGYDGLLATPFEQGSGRIDVAAALRAGLLFDETFDDYLAADPATGGDPRTLNLPSFADSECVVSCGWTRVATVPADTSAPVPDELTWTASVDADSGLAVDVELEPATVSPGDAMAITVTAEVSAGQEGGHRFARITLTPDDPAVPSVTMPVAVLPRASILPDDLDLRTRRQAGSQLVSGLRSLAVDPLQATVLGLAAPDETSGELVEDPTPWEPFDGPEGTSVHAVEVGPTASRFVVEVVQTEVADLDLFVGTGTVPDPDTIVCVSVAVGSAERCDLHHPAPGPYWVLAQSWAGSAAQPDAFLLASSVVDDSIAAGVGVDGPPGSVGAGEPYDLRVHWDLPDLGAGEVRYGTVVLGSSPGSPGDLGEIPVRLERVGLDVEVSASPAVARPGESVELTVAVQPNVTDADIGHSISIDVPEGLTVDPASLTTGAVIDGQTITWETSSPTVAGREGTYAMTTAADDPACAADGGFYDLEAEGFRPYAHLNGDTLWTTIADRSASFDVMGRNVPFLEISEDGFMSVPFGYGGHSWVPQAIPDPALPNAVFAPLWTDLEVDLATGSGLIGVHGPGYVMVQWDDLFAYNGPGPGAGASVGDFQAVVYTTVEVGRPEVIFRYDELDLSAITGPVTVGIENRSGTAGTAIVNAGAPPAWLSGATICFDYHGPVADPVVLTYRATVDRRAAGDLVTTVVHDTDDPHAHPETAAATVTVPGPTDLVASIKTSTHAVRRGAPVTLDVGVTNRGPNTALDARLSVELPGGVTFESVDHPSCAYDGTAHRVDCTAGTLAVGAQLSAAVVIRTPRLGIYLPVVRASSPLPDRRPWNNVAATLLLVRR